MAPSTKMIRLAEHLRHRLHGDIKDINPENIVPNDRSSDARVHFDQNIELAITKYGEKATETMLQRYYEKIKHIELEAELRVWEMLSGPELSFRDRAFEWGDKEEETYGRAQRVRAVHERRRNVRKEAGARKDEESTPSSVPELGKVKVESDCGQDVGKEKKSPQGPREREGTQGGRQHSMTPILKPYRHGAPSPPNRRVQWIMWDGERLAVKRTGQYRRGILSSANV